MLQSDIKRLWGLAAGRCSYPGCDTACVDFLPDDPKPLIIGDMAHVIAKSPTGPRSTSLGGPDTYSNLILLCPTHHRLVDQAPEGAFSPTELLQWKAEHEATVRLALTGPSFRDRHAFARYVRPLLIENKTTWSTYGPASMLARTNPLSSAADIWVLRKLDTIVPNNRRIINVIRKHRDVFDSDSYETACSFVEHAEGFERNCYRRSEDIPLFPQSFEEMIATDAAI